MQKCNDFIYYTWKLLKWKIWFNWNGYNRIFFIKIVPLSTAFFFLGGLVSNMIDILFFLGIGLLSLVVRNMHFMWNGTNYDFDWIYWNYRPWKICEKLKRNNDFLALALWNGETNLILVDHFCLMKIVHQALKIVLGWFWFLFCLVQIRF